ncbi:MAG: M61 family metallopeptidase [Flavobacteriales bacterium]|nr:M61 family metallopeptidase [Flavobacteriales bacterium]
MRFIPLFLFALITSTSLSGFGQKINYKLSMPEPHTHYFHVEIEIDGLKDDSIDVKMPVWAPGSYLVREFSKSVENFTADKGSFSLINKNTWRVYLKDKSCTISYDVYAFEMSVRTSFLDANHGYINGTSMFMYLNGKKELPSTLVITPPANWKKVSTSLERTSDKSFSYKAPNYDILVDSPIEIGNQQEFEFEASGVKHKVAMYGEGNFDIALLKTDMAKIVESCTDVVGENPNKEYTFIIHNLTNGSGGLEHLSSTTLQVNRWGYETGRKYEEFLSLVAHEYFHLWNVKRIRPITLGPFDYDSENYTNLLWLCEGFTSYYDELLLKRAGYYDADKYLHKLSNTISRVENQPGNKLQPVTEASFHAWIKAYRPTENSRNTTISYYPKGALLANALDLIILENTNAEKNLDDVLKLLWKDYYKKLNRGFTDKEFQTAVEQVARKKLNDFFKNTVAGTQTIDYKTYFNYAGCEIIDKNEGSENVKLGASTSSKNGRLMVTRVYRETAAYVYGLNVNDEIVAIDGYRVADNDLNTLIKSYKAGDIITITISRDGIMKDIKVTLKNDTNVNYEIVQIKNPSEKQQRVYKKWLSE